MAWASTTPKWGRANIKRQKSFKNSIIEESVLMCSQWE